VDQATPSPRSAPGTHEKSSPNSTSTAARAAAFVERSQSRAAANRHSTVVTVSSVGTKRTTPSVSAVPKAANIAGRTSIV
jgi:hypothetical protein